MRKVYAYLEMVVVCIFLMLPTLAIGYWLGGRFGGHEEIGLLLGGILALALEIKATIRNPRWCFDECEKVRVRDAEERNKRIQILLGQEPPRMKYPYFLINLALLILLLTFNNRFEYWFVYVGILIQTLKLFKCFRELSSVGIRFSALAGLVCLIIAWTIACGFAGLIQNRNISANIAGFTSLNIVWELGVLVYDMLAVKRQRSAPV